jgi:hemerythrin-like domain-containing protein
VTSPHSPIDGPTVSRRRLLTTGGVALAGAAVGAAAAGLGVHAADGGSGGATADLDQIPGTENLMYEHGVLKRVLLVYQEAGRRLAAGDALPDAAVTDAATIIHDYIESFHEALEEGYVFPRLKAAGMLVDTVDTLLLQHARGRLITQALLTSATPAGLANAATRAQVTAQMAAFVRMYQPHEAREDTVVFPTWRSLLDGRELEEMAELFSTDQTHQFGPQGFAQAVAHVTTIEVALGINDLAQFTPAAVT